MGAQRHLARCRRITWPGNVRELENTIERAVVLTTGSIITPDVVTIEPATSVRSSSRVASLKLRQNVEWIEYETIRRALEMSTRPNSRPRGRRASLPAHSPDHLAKYPNISQRNLGEA